MPDEMSSRDRLLASVEGRKVDRPPCFFRAEKSVSRRLLKELRLGSELELLGYFGVDAVHVHPAYRREKFDVGGGSGYIHDIFGTRYRAIERDGVYTETVDLPVLHGATKQRDLDRIRWPDSSVMDLEESIRRARQARRSGLAVYGGVWASVFTHSRAMLGEEDYLVALVENPSLIEEILRRVTDCYLGLNRAYLEACAEYLDVYYFGSDFGAQDSLLISPHMFRRFYKQSLARLAAQARGYGLKVMFHTCGAVFPIIGDLIDCGIDMLDPVQTSARGMSPGGLAAAFRGRIAFHGGICTQTVLRRGTPDDIGRAVRNLMETLGPTGCIVAPDQNFLPDVPLENIEAIYGAVRGYHMP